MWEFSATTLKKRRFVAFILKWVVAIAVLSYS